MKNLGACCRCGASPFDALMNHAAGTSPAVVTEVMPTSAERKEPAMKFFGYTLGDPNTPVGPESPEMYERMSAFVEEATKAGILLATGGLAPPSEAVKVRYSGGEFTVLDGPFAEAKELVGGWALMDTRDIDEAVEWTKRFLTIAGDGESTIRQVYGP